MKVKLTPALAYLFGLMKYRKARNGIGVKGGGALQAAFSSQVLRNKMVPPEKILVRGNEILFFHSAYKKFFDGLLDKETDCFRHQNEYAAAFLAGLFDSVGFFYEKEDVPAFARFDKKDWAVLEQLGYRTMKKDGALLVGPGEQFLKFIKGSRNVDDMDILESKNELLALKKKK